MNNQTIKLSLKVSPELNEVIEQMSEESHTSKTDVLKKAIFLMEVALKSKKQGNKIAIVNKDGQQVTEIIGY